MFPRYRPAAQRPQEPRIPPTNMKIPYISYRHGSRRTFKWPIIPAVGSLRHHVIVTDGDVFDPLLVPLQSLVLVDAQIRIVLHFQCCEDR